MAPPILSPALMFKDLFLDGMEGEGVRCCDSKLVAMVIVVVQRQRKHGKRLYGRQGRLNPGSAQTRDGVQDALLPDGAGQIITISSCGDRHSSRPETMLCETSRQPPACYTSSSFRMVLAIREWRLKAAFFGRCTTSSRLEILVKTEQMTA